MRWCASTRTPRPSASPAEAASSVRGSTPIPTTTKSQSIFRPSVVTARSTTRSPSKALSPVPVQQLDTVLAVQIGVHAADLRAEHALQRHVVGLEHGDLEAALAQRRGDLRADPAGADDHHLAAAHRTLADRLGVAHLAQVEHVPELGPGDGEAPWPGARGQEQAVIAEALAPVDDDLRCAHIDRAHRRRRAQLDVVLPVEALVVDEQLRALGLALEVVLRQSRSLIRAIGLGADQHDTAVEPFGAQRLGRLRPGQTGTDDHERGSSGHDGLLVLNANLMPDWRRRGRSSYGNRSTKTPYAERWARDGRGNLLRLPTAPYR